MENLEWKNKLQGGHETRKKVKQQTENLFFCYFPKVGFLNNDELLTSIGIWKFFRRST